MQYTDCCLTVSQCVDRQIPAGGEGTSGTNYDETASGYSTMKRRNRTVTPGGTIMFLVYDPRGNVLSTYVGTNDTGAIEQNLAGTGTPNNMKLVTANEYDSGTSGGDGNPTKRTQSANGTTTRVTAMSYDFRDRRIDTDGDGEIDDFERLGYDNLDRVIRSDRYDTPVSGHLIARQETKFDDRGRTYQTIRSGVNPNTRTVGNSQSDHTWFDAARHVIKSLPAGSWQGSKPWESRESISSR